mgnify:CR=1 FL=1
MNDRAVPPSPERQAERRWAIAVAIVVVAFCAPMAAAPDGFLSGDAYRDNDWLTDRLFDLLARQAILGDGVFPLRSPLVGGGYPTLGHPFDGSWAPTLLPILLLGPVWGVKVNLLLFTLLGAWGTGRLARDVVGLTPSAAAFAALAFALSGWLPGMMLVGFYPQALVFVVPGALALLLAPRTRGDPVVAGFLLFLLFQQGGNAFVAASAFVLVAVLVVGSPDLRSALLVVGGTLLATAGLAVGRRYAVLWPALLGPALGVLVLASPWLREARAALRPRLVVLGGVLVVAGTLGVGKATALLPLMGQATYAHVANAPPSDLPVGKGPGRALTPSQRDEHFYNGPRELLEGIVGRAPRVGTYQPSSQVLPSRVPIEETDRRFATREYQWLGFTPGLLVVALVGAVRRRSWPFALLAALLGLFLLGPHAPGDLYLLVAGGLPLAEGIRQPVKYYNVYLLLSLAVLAGVGAEELGRRLGRGAPALGLLLLWPLLQNAPVWADRFAEPLPAWSCDGCLSVKQVGHPAWVPWGDEEIERSSRALFLREQRRPPAAREYDNALRGVRTIDWYGTLALPEPTIPSHYVTPTGTVLPNPRSRGDAWVLGEGEVTGLRIGVNTVSVEARLEGPGRVVVNQAWRRGFVSTHPGAPEDGLLAADLPAGMHRVDFRYRPWGQIAGLGGSAACALLWGGLWWRRRREAP